MSNTSISNDQLRDLLFATENGNNHLALNTFSYAGNGNSSYSFGILQFDVRSNHGNVQQFLMTHGFTSDQIHELSRHGGIPQDRLDGLNTQLGSIPSADIDAFTRTQLQSSIQRIDDLIGSLRTTNPTIAELIAASPAMQLVLADYDNQFHIDRIGGKSAPNTMLSYLEGNEVNLPGARLRLDGSVAPSDIQRFINATEYGVANPRSVANREQRLQGAMSLLQLADGIVVRPNEPANPHKRTESLREGAQGDEVFALQEALAGLHYRGSQGGLLRADGYYGPSTKAAVQTFQREQGLVPDGVFGPTTRGALAEETLRLREQHSEAATPTALSDPQHPDNAFFQQVRGLVHQLDAQHNRTPDQLSDNLAAAVVVAARAGGLSKIDQLALSDDASSVWILQNGQSEFRLGPHVRMDTLQAVNTSMEQSAAAWPKAMEQFQQTQQEALQRQAQLDQQRDINQAPSHSMSR